MRSKPCALGKRHSWKHVTNGTLKKETTTARSIRVCFRGVGLYRCACGAERFGSVKAGVVQAKEAEA